MRIMTLVLMMAAAGWAAELEVGGLWGALRSAQSPAVRGFVNDGGRLNGGLQVNFAARWRDRLYLETPFVAGPNAQSAGPSGGGYASLFLTPGLRWKLAAADARVTPFVFAGGGYAQFERYAIQGVIGDRREHAAAASFGGGVDVRLRAWLAARGEFRQFVAQGQGHSFVGGGLVWRLRR
jgi:hypothetical protein